VRTTPIRRSKRTTLSVYRGKGGQEGSAPLIKKLVGNDLSNKRVFWNCRGFRKKEVASYIRDLLRV
jgi:hypothetical protein